MPFRLTPILPVHDVVAELRFYVMLGFRQHVDPIEQYPPDAFAAVADGDHLLFGLARADAGVATPPPGLTWQFEASELDEVVQRAQTGGVDVISLPKVQPWGRRLMSLRSPNGYEVGFEEC